MFLVPSVSVLFPFRSKPEHRWVPWLGVGMLFALMMGLRHEVGGDWFTYLPHFQRTAQLHISEVLTQSDPGYYGLNWLVAKYGGDIYGVNLVCASVLIWGTVVFCRAQPIPWLALVATVPYMLSVVGMGYTRQSVALGFALLGLTALGNDRTRVFIFWVAIGATFHKSAVLLMPIAALAASRNRYLTAALVAVTTALLYYLLLADDSERLWVNYVEAKYHSDGGQIRVLMNVVPATIFVVFRRRQEPEPQQRKLWMWMALLAIACLPLVSLASTAVDRVALYLIPLQAFVASRLPRLAHSIDMRTLTVLGVIFYYATVLFVWLNFAKHAKYWVPYQFMPLGWWG